MISPELVELSMLLTKNVLTGLAPREHTRVIQLAYAGMGETDTDCMNCKKRGNNEIGKALAGLTICKFCVGRYLSNREYDFEIRQFNEKIENPA